MPRKVIYIENIDTYPYNNGVWHDQFTQEENERRWSGVALMHELIYHSGVGLSDKQRVCIEWYLEGKTFTQMGRDMGITYPGARAHFLRGVAKIKKYVKHNNIVF